MYVIKNLLSLCLIFLVCNSFVCSFPSPEEKNDKPKEDPSDSEKKEPENELGSVSPEEIDKLKEEIIENQEENAEKFGLPLTSSPDEVVTFLEEEEEKYGKDLPDKIEEDLNAGSDDDDDDEFKNLVHFLELFDKIESESSDTEEKEIEKSPAEMKEMKEEAFKLTNELNERKELPAVSQEKFDKVWDQKEEKYGKMFPAKIEKVIHLLKIKEEIKEAVMEKEEKVSESPPEISTEESEKPKEAPKNAFVVKNEKGKVCILAKFHSIITITFPGITSEMKAEVPVPETGGEARGKCRDPSKPRSMHLSWNTFNFTLVFNKTSEDMWAVTSIEFSYDTSGPLFDGAANPGKVTAKSKKDNWFETPLGKAYLCPAQEVILLYSEDQHVATARMKDTHLQPYDVEDGKFSSSHRCNQVVIDGLNEEPFVQDETIPLAVGCTLALITLLILVGFSVHRAYNAAKVDYNTME